MMMTAAEIRKAFLDFFASKGHTVAASDSLVPKDDPTVLFTTAGMQQFKRQFLGDIDGFTRAATAQKCLRTDDLEQVGITNFHHTFFEMLGNFSFGDYFKQEAISWAWEFLTEVVRLPPEKIWVSVYRDDREAEEIWRSHIKFPEDKLVRLGDKSNFWPSNAKKNGPNGPCGPCSEIFYDYGVNPACTNPRCNPDCDCGRFSEIWNLVFTQFDRKDKGVLVPLPAKNIDTGMGLERLTAVLQGKHNNFDTDLFLPIRQAVQREISPELPRRDECVIADHIRAVVFGIADGIIPSNKERGSVMKRLINDSANIALNYGPQEPRIYKLVPAVVNVMGNQYPELADKAGYISGLIRKTEEAFIQVRAVRIPEFKALDLKTMTAEERGGLYFKFRDTYGLPLSVILSTARDKGISPDVLERDLEHYRALMAAQQDRSRAASKMSGDVFTNTELKLNVAKTEFLGYQAVQCPARILKLFVGQEERQAVGAGEEVQCALDATVCYAESGGQIGDQGTITGPGGMMSVSDTKKISDIVIHAGDVVSGSLAVGDVVTVAIDQERRLAVMRNHTATHLLQAALRAILGEHVQQQGSYVDDEKLRFDFSHPQALTAREIRDIEDFVNSKIIRCDPVRKETLALDAAKERGALAFFAEKYTDTVRVVSVADYSMELCGGTHLDSTGQIGLFKVINETAIAQGIRRIEARTGLSAYRLVARQQEQLNEIAAVVKAPVPEILERLSQQQKRMRQLEKDRDLYQFESVKSSISAIIQQARVYNTVRVIPHTFDGLSADLLRKTADLIKQQNPDAVIILASVMADNALVLLVLPAALTKAGWDAGVLIREVAAAMNGSGGGRAQMAQAGSKDPRKVPAAMAKALEIIKSKSGD